jgi:hypothetical protein
MSLKTLLIALASLALFAGLLEGGVLLLFGEQPKFPRRVVGADFDVRREGLVFLAAADILLPHVGSRELYWLRSHGHWTAFSHEVVGKALGRLIVANGLLDS